MPEKIRDMLGASSMILLMVAVIILGLGIKNMLTVRPASAYEDKGVHTFTPVEIYPVQKKNTSSYGRSRRMNPTTTVYKVRYEATDGSGYRCSREAGSTETSAQLLAAEGDIERRVLYVRDESVTVTIDPSESAESYVAGQRKQYFLMIVIPSLLIIASIAVFVFKRTHQNM